MMKTIILFVSISIASGLLLVNMYTSLVDVKSWGSDVPNSIAAARNYFKVANPGDFFRLFSPLNQALALLVLVLFWKSSTSIRIYLGVALVLYVLSDAFTFAYFYPRQLFYWVLLYFVGCSFCIFPGPSTSLMHKGVTNWPVLLMHWLLAASPF